MTVHQAEAVANRQALRDIPLFNDQRLKLGVFGSNCSGGIIMSEAPTDSRITWDQQLRVAQQADRMGMELIVPVARWKGFGGRTNFMGSALETFTWAAGLAQATEQISIFATTHLPAVHPIVAAKQAATIDQIAGGRFGMNMVMGWFKEEIEMFGRPQYDHTARYAYGQEWLDFAQHLWTAPGPFDFDGQFFTAFGAESEPKPILSPRPALICAGNSPTGMDFSARNVDVNLAVLDSLEGAREYKRKISALAADSYHRTLDVFTYGLVVCRETEKEAKQAVQGIIDQGDTEGADLVISGLGIESESYQGVIDAFRERFVLGWGGTVLVGTPEQVTEQLAELSEAGIGGIILGFHDYANELEDFDREVMPLLRKEGLRH
ncbi:LLM class flavin-dependent oxidoreductase [Pseudonocardia xishanensis]